MKDLFAKIEQLIPTIPGWCDVPKASHLAAIVLSLKPNITVEIGVFGGRSFLPMALAHRHNACGTIIGIDPWSAVESANGQTTEPDRKYWAEVDHESIYNAFNNQVLLLAVQNVCRILRMKSDDVDPPPMIDVLHVDGNHNENAARDTQRFAAHVRIGGICILDDLHWSGGGVARAEQVLINYGFQKLYPLGTGAVYQRVK